MAATEDEAECEVVAVVETEAGVVAVAVGTFADQRRGQRTNEVQVASATEDEVEHAEVEEHQEAETEAAVEDVVVPEVVEAAGLAQKAAQK